MRNPFEPFPSFGNGGQNDYQGLNACLIMKTERVRSLKRSEHHFKTLRILLFWFFFEGSSHRERAPKLSPTVLSTLDKGL